MMQYERFVRWAQQTWETRFPGQPYATVWAMSECSNHIAQSSMKPGKRLRGQTRYEGVSPLDCPLVVPISDYGARGQRIVLTTSSGAYVFRFSDVRGATFEVIYVAGYLNEDAQNLNAIAIIPPDRLEAWAAFEAACVQTVRPRIRRRRDVYIIGGNDSFFDPTIEWENVILADDLKNRLMDDIEAFFTTGVDIYRQLKLPPFRKLLLAGVPGTGKTMLCAALAKLAIKKRRVVVYVSGADRDGASFEKIQRALQAVAAARYPVLMIVEEIDAYLQGNDKARVLNVLDGVESPNNPRGALLLATTNYPEAIDERISKRPGRLDRVFVVPPIADEAMGEQMLRHYMADQWQENHIAIVSDLVDQSGAFVREVALHARMLAAHERRTEVTLAMLKESVGSLKRQLKAESDFLHQRRPISLVNPPKRPHNPFDRQD